MTLKLVSRFTLQIVFLKFRLSQTSPSRGDPADDSSKGMLAQDANWERFHNGPKYLWRSEEEWPAKQIVSRPFPAYILATSIVQKGEEK